MEELIVQATVLVGTTEHNAVLKFDPPVTVATADAYAKAWLFDHGYDSDSDWQLVCFSAKDIVTINAERGKNE